MKYSWSDNSLQTRSSFTGHEAIRYTLEKKSFGPWGGSQGLLVGLIFNWNSLPLFTNNSNNTKRIHSRRIVFVNIIHNKVSEVKGWRREVCYCPVINRTASTRPNRKQNWLHPPMTTMGWSSQVLPDRARNRNIQSLHVPKRNSSRLTDFKLKRSNALTCWSIISQAVSPDLQLINQLPL